LVKIYLTISTTYASRFFHCHIAVIIEQFLLPAEPFSSVDKLAYFKNGKLQKENSHPFEYLPREKNQRAPPGSIPEYSEAPEIVPYDDGWPGYDEPVFDF